MPGTTTHLLYVGKRSDSWPRIHRVVSALDGVDALLGATEARRALELLEEGGCSALVLEGRADEEVPSIADVRRLDPSVPIVVLGDETDSTGGSDPAAPPLSEGDPDGRGPVLALDRTELAERPDEVARRINGLIEAAPAPRPRVTTRDLDDGLLVVDALSHRIVWLNQAVCSIHGFRREALLGRSIDELFGSEPPYTPREIRRWMRRAEAKGPQVFEWLTRSKDGASVPVEIRLRHRDDGEIGSPHFTALIRPVAHRERQLTDLRKQWSFREAALDRMQDLFFIFTLEGEMVYWTQRAVEITGYSDEEIAAMSPEEFVPEEEREHVRSQVNEIERTGSTRTEVQIETREGHRIPYEVTGTRMEWGDRRYVCGIARNVTERSRAVTALRRSERRYRRLFEDSRDAIAITTPEGAIIDANPAAMKMLGYMREELPDLNAATVYANPARREEIQARLEHQGFIRDEEVRFRTNDEEEVIVLLTMSVRRDEGGHVEAYQSIFRDITERKRAEQALQESEEKFRTLAEKSLVGVYLVQDGLFKYINPRGADMLGYEPKELIEKHGPRLIVHPQDWPLVAENLQRRLSGEEDALNYSFRAVTKHDETIFVEVYGVRISYQGRPAILGTALDQTERRRLEQELVQVQEEERRRISQDLHDGLASKLSGIEMMTRTLARRAAGDAEIAADRLEEIAELINEGNEEVHRLAEGLNPIQVRKHGLSGALRELAEGHVRTEGLEASFEIEGQVPELDEEVATHLYRVAQEAVENATRHADAGRVDLRLEAGSERIDLVVEDDGSGFDPADPPGEGMGLHTMRYRADLIGGDLLIDERPTGGTVVRCTIPRSRAVVKVESNV